MSTLKKHVHEGGGTMKVRKLEDGENVAEALEEDINVVLNVMLL
jgi:hypothetical protein